MTNDDLTHWEEVLEGQRENDPADGIDLEQLALSLIREVRIARQLARAAYWQLPIPLSNKAHPGKQAHEVYEWLK